MPFEFQFGAAAEAYCAFRPEYPRELFDRILAHIPSGRRHCALDLGAGTGKATSALTEYFVEVIAVEPDPRMAEKISGVAPHAKVHITRAEEFTHPAGTVDLVNIATALHWMDVPLVISRVSCWLRGGGILAVYSSEFPKTPKPIRDIIKREFTEHWDQFRDARLKDKQFPQSLLRSSTELAFIEETSVADLRSATPQEFTGFCRSTSYGSAYGRSLANPEWYWRWLESRFRDGWPDARIPVDMSRWLILMEKL